MDDIREKALRLAIEFYKPMTATIEEILVAALQFEEYLRGDLVSQPTDSYTSQA